MDFCLFPSKVTVALGFTHISIMLHLVQIK